MPNIFQTFKIVGAKAPYTEELSGAVAVSGGAADAFKFVVLDATGHIDASMISGGSGVSVNGTPVSTPNFNDTTPAALGGRTNVVWQFDGSGNVSASYLTTGGATSFAGISSGTNTTAAMDVGNGASLFYSGTGVVNANEIGTINIDGNTPAHAGQLLISQPGNTTAVWADPLVQGLYPDGTLISTPINPVYVGGQSTDGKLYGFLTDASKYLLVTATQATGTNLHTVVDSGSITAMQATGTNLHTVVDSGAVTVSGTVAFSNTTIAVTNAGTFAVQATLAAETTKVIGTVNQGTSPWVVSGTVTADAGTGNFTVVQATGTNLHAVIDTGSTTAVTQATGTNLHTVVDSGAVTVSGTVAFSNTTIAVTNAGTFAVQATLSAETTKVIGTVNQGTSPWVISGAVTTSGTATVVGTLTHDSAAPTGNNVGVLPAIANVAGPTYNEGDQVLLSTDLAGNLRVSITGTVVASNDITEWATVTLGAPTAFGTAPSGNVIGTNAELFAGATALTATGTSLNANVTGGTVTATQATGTNLHTVVDSGSITATQATGTNLHTVVDSGSITATQATGTNLHTVVDSGAVTVSGTVAFSNTTIAVTNAGTFAVQATLAAETTKVIGTVNQGTSPWVTSGTSTVSGTVTSEIVGNIGGVLDSIAGGTAPANVLQVGGSDYTGKSRTFATDIFGDQAIIGRSSTPVIIQKANNNNSGAASTTLTCAFGSNVKQGNTLLAFLVIDGSVTGTVFSDSQNNAWAGQSLTGSAAAGMTVYCARTIAGASGANTVTVTATSAIMVLQIYEVAGCGLPETPVPALATSGTAVLTTAIQHFPRQRAWVLRRRLRQRRNHFQQHRSRFAAQLVCRRQQHRRDRSHYPHHVLLLLRANVPASGYQQRRVRHRQHFRPRSRLPCPDQRNPWPSASRSARKCCKSGEQSSRQSPEVRRCWTVLPLPTCRDSSTSPPRAAAVQDFSPLPTSSSAAVHPTLFNGTTFDRARSASQPSQLTSNTTTWATPIGQLPAVITSGPAGTTIQSRSAVSTGSVATLTAVTNNIPTKGNTFVVVCAVGNGSAPAVTDNNGTPTTYKLVASQLGPASAFGIYIFYGIVASSLNAVTVTVTPVGSTSVAMEVYEVTGLLAISAQQPDQTTSSSGNSGTALANAIQPGYANEIVFAGVALGTAAQTITPASGWINDSGQQNSAGTPAGLFSFVSMSQFAPDFQSVAPSATFTSEPWAIASASFRPIGITTAEKRDILGNALVSGITPFPKIVQKANGVTASGTSLAVAFTSPVKAGNTIVVMGAVGIIASIAASVTDNLNNNYLPCGLSLGSAVTQLAWYAPVTAGGVDTVTMAFASAAAAMEVYEIQGIGIVDTFVAATATSTAPAATAVIAQENELAFFSVGAGAQTISQASPVTPTNLAFDSGNLATGGSNLVNFGSFSSLLGGPAVSGSGNFTINSNKFQALLGGSVAWAALVVTFRPQALQIFGVVQPQGIAIALGDGITNTPVSPAGVPSSGSPALTQSTSGIMYSQSMPYLFNGSTWDRARAALPPTSSYIAAGSLSAGLTGLAGVGVVSGPACAVVQSKAGTPSVGSVASVTVVPTNTIPRGNTCVVVVGVGNGSAPTVADNSGNGNVYRLVASQLGPASAFGIYIFHCVLAGAGTGTITATNGGANASMVASFYEVAGALAISLQQPDQSSTAVGTSATAASAALIPQYANEILISGVALGTAAQTITPASGWINDSGQQNPTGTPAGLFSFISMSQFVPDFQQVTPQATFTSEPWAIAAVSLRPIGVTIQGRINPTPDTVLAGNSTTALLGSNGVFTGTTVDTTLTPIASVKIMAISNVPSANGGLQIQWSNDASNWDNIDTSTVTAANEAVVTSGVYARYFRVVYTNGTATQAGGFFRLQTTVSPIPVQPTIKDLPTQITTSDAALVTHTVIAGRSQTTGNYTDVATDALGNLSITAGGAGSDAFGRLRISEPTTLFNVSFQYDAQPLLMNTVVNGSATATKTANVSSVTLSTVDGTTAHGVDFISKQYSRYEPGKSQLIVMTGTIGAAKANVRSLIGYFDTNDGVFFDQNNGMNVTQRTSTSGSPVDTPIAQASWNVDKCDGTGPSAFNADFTKTQIFFIDFEWLGTGRVRFGFFDKGIPIIAHQIYNDNTITVPYMNTANLPLHWAIHNTGAASGATTMTAICGSVLSEGGQQQPKALQFSASNGITGISVGTTLLPLISISPSLLFNSIANRGAYKLLDLGIMNQNNNMGQWVLRFNPSLAGTPAFASVDPESSMTFDVAASGIGAITISATSTTAGVTTYTWAGNSINGASQGLNNQWLGYKVVVSGYNGANTGNNGTFTITASTGTTFTVTNASGTNATTGAPVFSVPGQPLFTGYFQANNNGGGLISPPDLANLKTVMGLDAAAAIGDVMTLCAQAQTATDTVYGNLVWSEER